VRNRLAAFARARTPTDELPPDVVGEIGALHADRAREEPLGLMADGSDLGRRTLLDRVLRRQPEAVVPAEVLAELDALDRTLAKEEGEHVLHDSRLLLEHLGRDRLRLYAAPTTTGQVWLYLVARELDRLKGGWMVSALPDGISWQLSFKREPGEPTYVRVFGVVANEVAAVEVKLKGDTRSAVLGNNGFFYEATGLEPDEVVGLVLQCDADESRLVSISGTD
jgi:hypothetical protein